MLKLFFGKFATPILTRVRLTFVTPVTTIKNTSVCQNHRLFLTWSFSKPTGTSGMYNTKRYTNAIRDQLARPLEDMGEKPSFFPNPPGRSVASGQKPRFWYHIGPGSQNEINHSHKFRRVPPPVSRQIWTTSSTYMITWLYGYMQSGPQISPSATTHELDKSGPQDFVQGYNLLIATNLDHKLQKLWYLI